MIMRRSQREKRDISKSVSLQGVNLSSLGVDMLKALFTGLKVGQKLRKAPQLQAAIGCHVKLLNSCTALAQNVRHLPSLTQFIYYI